MREIRLAVSGCGSKKWGHGFRSHILPGVALGFKLTAVYDPSKKNIQEVRELLGTDFVAYKTFDEMVVSPDIDAILITSPNKFHPAQLLAAVKAGKPVLCDKPLAIDPAGLELVARALDLAIANNVPVMSCLPRRETPPYAWMKEQFPNLKEKFGALQYAVIDFSYQAAGNEWKKKLPGLLLDQFLHKLDWLLWLLGEASFQARRECNGTDRYTVSGTTAGQVSFLFNGSRRLATSTDPETVLLRFDRATCEGNTKTGVITIRRHEDERIETIFGPSISYSERFPAIMAHFAAMIERGEADIAAINHLRQISTAAVLLTTEGCYLTPANSSSAHPK